MIFMCANIVVLISSRCTSVLSDVCVQVASFESSASGQQFLEVFQVSGVLWTAISPTNEGLDLLPIPQEGWCSDELEYVNTCLFSGHWLLTIFVKQAAQRGGSCSVPGDIQGQAAPLSEHLMELGMSLFIAGQLDWMAFEGPFWL